MAECVESYLLNHRYEYECSIHDRRGRLALTLD